MPLIAVLVALLAGLKAGGAYLPVDPGSPGARIEHLLADSGARLVVAQARFAHLAGHVDGRPSSDDVVDLDDERSYASDGSPLDPASAATHLAYVIYTSGSTGTPKGVAITHRGAVNNFTDFVRRFDLKQWDPLLAVSPMSFDMSVYDLLGTLAGHGTVVIPTPAQDREPASWAALIREHLVAVWHSAPALLELLCDYSEKARRDGILSLEDVVEDVDDMFLKKGMQLVVDGTESDTIAALLENEIFLYDSRRKEEASIFETAGGFSPTMGIIGTVMGLVLVLSLLNNDPKARGHAIATAALATRVGAALICPKVLRCRIEKSPVRRWAGRGQYNDVTKADAPSNVAFGLNRPCQLKEVMSHNGQRQRLVEVLAVAA